MFEIIFLLKLIEEKNTLYLYQLRLFDTLKGNLMLRIVDIDTI